MSGWRQAELAAETSQELRRSIEAGAELLVGLGEPDRLGHEEPQRERELARRHSTGDVLQRDSRILECGHQADDVHGGGRELPVLLVRLEDAELVQPAHVLERAGYELGELLGRDRRH